MEKEESRGRGAPKGRRPVVWVCSGLVETKLVCEKFLVSDQSPSDLNGNFPKEIAEQGFLAKHGIMPEVMYGPFAETRKAGGEISLKKKKLSISRDIADLKLSSKEKQAAIFGEWKGIVHYLDDQDDKGFFVFLQEEKMSNIKKTLPAPGVVLLSDLIFNNISNMTE